MTTVEYMPIHVVSTNAGVFGDVANHCNNWKYYMLGNSKSTGVHEGTHGVNSQLRNQTTNGFYLLGNRAIKLVEPPTKKSACAKHVPVDMQYSRFKNYVLGQRAFENTPLYIFDEWTAYLNSSKYVVAELPKENKGTDCLFGPVEFCAYGIATAIEANRPDITEFTHWMVQESLNIYLKGRSNYPWAQADRCYDQLLKNFKDYVEVPNAWAR